ncbi:Hypothetical protein FKW44_007722 [Caligus rogercresseyi]|uniref:Uncharacterized protein n=1 Tax=Caligus rogercresseyi TaxID=217165 RepID=A0A7T8KF75_CALRO|nr:Hypothetical protein FKW44_007722 [Caligus rogercresseyi]
MVDIELHWRVLLFSWYNGPNWWTSPEKNVSQDMRGNLLSSPSVSLKGTKPIK